MNIHVVQSGETVTGIARLYGVSPQKIITDNGLENQDTLAVGQALLIQYPQIIHTVQPGETLAGIAGQYGITVLALLQNNPHLATQPVLRPGEQVTILYRDRRTREVSINGYAYPHINQEVLLRSLPFLTQLTIFGYGFTADGQLIEINDQPLINLAYQFRVAPIMLLSSITESGGFSGERASLLFRDTAFQNALIDKIIQKMWEKGYLGLDVDFEYINPEDADDLGIKDDEVVRASTRRGSVEIPAKVTPDIVKGVMFIPFHYKEHPANRLTNNALDPIAKIPEFKACAVKVEKIAEA